MKKEYRGQRSLEALVEHIRDLLKDPVKELTTTEEIENVDVSICYHCLHVSLFFDI